MRHDDPSYSEDRHRVSETEVRVAVEHVAKHFGSDSTEDRVFLIKMFQWYRTQVQRPWHARKRILEDE